MIFGNMGEMIKMAREMQGKMKQIKEELSRQVFEEKNNGVSATVSGDMELKEIKIEPGMVDPNKVAQLEKSVQEAVGKAFKRAKDTAAKKMGSLTGGLGLPGMF